MKTFNKIGMTVLVIILIIFAGTNLFLIKSAEGEEGRPYRVEIHRVVHQIEKEGLQSVNLSQYEYVTNVEKCEEDFYDTNSDYVVSKINEELYRIEYAVDRKSDRTSVMITVNLALGIMAAAILLVMLYLRQKILHPFEKLTDVPYELSKGNLTVPIKENKSRFFGRFLWGVDLLRENMEQQKQRELDLQKDKKMLLLSLSHDIKTPLSAIKLYAKALSKGLYTDKDKKCEIAENINTKADEIEDYVSQIIRASREDFLSLDVNMSEFYLSELIQDIKKYYAEKLDLVKIEFSVSDFKDCLIKGDLERSIEVMQNIMENAVKYGDGRCIALEISEEEGGILISVRNSGNTLKDAELPHVFESFWRGTNAEKQKGSGLGLYICRQLMHKMKGEMFAEIKEEFMCVTAVFMKA